MVTIRGEPSTKAKKKKHNPYEVHKKPQEEEEGAVEDVVEEYAKWESECGVTRWVSVLRSARLTKMKLEMDLIRYSLP